MRTVPTRARVKAKVIDLLNPLPSPPPNKTEDLLWIAREAVNLEWTKLPFSVAGRPAAWLPPYRSHSEFNILDPWQLAKTARYLADLIVPAFSKPAPDLARILFPPLITRGLWRPTNYFRQEGKYAQVSSFPDEQWFFINGIATNSDVIKINSTYLANLFHRPMTVVHNATCSFLLDMHECVMGKGFQDREDGIITESAWRATAAILSALNSESVRHVVVIAHSQGTIITANVLRVISNAFRFNPPQETKSTWHPFTKSVMGEIRNDTHKVMRDNLAHALFEFMKHGPQTALERLGKLEIYTFANCADKMCYISPDRQIPYMEHFANEMDIVARLGVLSPLRHGDEELIEIDGPVFVQKDGLGHLLNEHYLMPIDDYLYPGTGKWSRDEDPYPSTDSALLQPHLYSYFHGKRPERDRT